MGEDKNPALMSTRNSTSKFGTDPQVSLSIPQVSLSIHDSCSICWTLLHLHKLFCFGFTLEMEYNPVESRYFCEAA